MARILIVDDEEQVRSMLRTTLERVGCAVIEAANGNDALTLHQQTPADIIILDLLMPEKEGIETLLELRRQSSRVKIVAISGGGVVAPQQYLVTAARFGADRVFAKPVNRSELLIALKELLASEVMRGRSGEMETPD